MNSKRKEALIILEVEKIIRESSDENNFNAKNWFNLWKKEKNMALNFDTPENYLKKGKFLEVLKVIKAMQSGVYL